MCQKHKDEAIHPLGLLEPLPMPEQLWKDLLIDFIEGLPSSGGYTTILVVVNRFSKYCHFILVKHPMTAPQIAQVFHENIFKLYRVPKSITSDRERLFTSKF